jgi:hypothetical protein
VSAGSPVALAVTVDPTTLSVGTFAATLTVSSGATGGTINIPLTISVASHPQRMALAQRGFLFTAVQGGGVTPPQNLSVLNIGSGSFSWSASAVLLSGGPQWLSVTPASGSSSAGSGHGDRRSEPTPLAGSVLRPGSDYVDRHDKRAAGCGGSAQPAVVR